MRHNDQRDDNEPELVKYLQAAGWAWIPAPRGMGFDGLAMRDGRVLFIEIKNPAHTWRLTPREQAVKAIMELHGIPYHIVESDADLARLIGQDAPDEADRVGR
jgi:hypothetical protein